MTTDHEDPKRSKSSRRDFGGIDVQQTKRRGGGKLARSETVTVRLDPKLRYLAELAARKQRRTLSSFIEWVIEVTLNNVSLTDGGSTLASEAAELWDVDEPDRFVLLALRYPEMLTHEEQVLWKLVRENGALWRGHFDEDTGEWSWPIVGRNFLIEKFREHWAIFNAVARGDAEPGALPTWTKRQPSTDDEIPF